MIRFTPTARACFHAWLANIARPDVRPTVVEAEALDVIRARAEAGETLSYELGQQYTTTGRPEDWTAALSDIDAPTWTLAETDTGLPYGTGPTQAAALDDAAANRRAHDDDWLLSELRAQSIVWPSFARDWLLSELRAGHLAWCIESANV